ncbi:MAG: hypothetical protein JWO82_2557 [Akkermansiaceae bacterium]|nr:hypothetical protein [Akkermansiaceae bacterium]
MGRVGRIACLPFTLLSSPRGRTSVVGKVFPSGPTACGPTLSPRDSAPKTPFRGHGFARSCLRSAPPLPHIRPTPSPARSGINRRHAFHARSPQGGEAAGDFIPFVPVIPAFPPLPTMSVHVAGDVVIATAPHSSRASSLHYVPVVPAIAMLPSALGSRPGSPCGFRQGSAPLSPPP